MIATVRNWPVYLLNRYGWISTGTVTYRLRNGFAVLSRPFRTDGSALNDVWHDASYDPNHFGIPFDWNACKTIVDIGANIGTFTLYAAYRAPRARIVAVEREPGNSTMFRKNIAVNRLGDRVSLSEAGIAQKPGVGLLFVAHKNSGGHSLFRYTDESHPIDVRFTTLQSVFNDHRVASCDFLKLDCEGGEYAGLYGLRDKTLASVAIIAVEYHHFSKEPAHAPEHLKAFLEKHGFTVMSPKKSIYFAYRA